MNEYDDAYVLRMKRIAGMLGGHDVSVLVDSHQDMYTEAYRGEGFPDWARLDRGIRPLNCCWFPLNYASSSSVATWNDFWANRALLWTRFRNQWTMVAATMRDLDNVVGYDVINEPWAGGSWRRCLLPGGCTTFETQRLQRMQEHVIAGIRSVDATSPVWWEANTLTSFGRANRVGAYRPVRDPAGNTVLSFHAYCMLGGSVPFLSRAADPTCPAVHRSTFGQAAGAARRSGSASVLTEFGASDDVFDIARVARLADANMTSWYYWHYGAWRDPTGVVATQGLFADDADRSSLKQAKADVLVRTYPQAVAGLPMSYSFAPERADRRFHLTFVTQVRIHAPTVISVPVARHYADGYDVLVQGPARVTSAPDAPLLQLEATGDGLVYVQLVRRGFAFAG
jgi:endoglycosylceramidase